MEEKNIGEQPLKEGSSFGKFANVETLRQAYDNLEKEFTRKSQLLSDFQKQAEQIKDADVLKLSKKPVDKIEPLGKEKSETDKKDFQTKIKEKFESDNRNYQVENNKSNDGKHQTENQKDFQNISGSYKTDNKNLFDDGKNNQAENNKADEESHKIYKGENHQADEESRKVDNEKDFQNNNESYKKENNNLSDKVSGEVPYWEKEDWSQQVKDFLNENPLAKQYAKEISKMVMEDKALLGSSRPLYSAWAKWLQNNYKMPEQLLNDEQFLMQIQKNEKVRRGVIKDYLAGFSDRQNTPPLFANSDGGVISGKKQSPQNLDEARELARKIFSK